MARWKLMTSHYLMTEDNTEWEYKEIDNVTQREVRRRRKVPRFLDINDPSDWNNRLSADPGVSRGGKGPDGQGEIIVCMPGKGLPGDVGFFGDPTPDMMPIDDEARDISASFADRWRYRPENNEISWTQSQAEMISHIASQQAPPSTVQVAGMEELVQSLTTLTGLIASQQVAKAAPAPDFRLKG